MIQHDRATPHTGGGTEAALNIACVEDGWNILWEDSLLNPQAAILAIADIRNILRIAIEGFESNTDMRTMTDLTDAMTTAANDHDWQTIERLHGTPYAIFCEILKSGGTNDNVCRSDWSPTDTT